MAALFIGGWALLLAAISVASFTFPLAIGVPLTIVLPTVVLVAVKAIAFERLKLATMIVGRVLYTLTVLGIMPVKVFIPLLIWILRVNILEAVAADVSIKRYGNAVAGVALVVSSLWLDGAWVSGTTYYFFSGTFIVPWIAAYTLWNWTFIGNYFSKPLAAYHVAVLAAPLLYVTLTWQPGFWLIMRSITLNLGGCVHLTARQTIEDRLQVPWIGRLVDALRARTARLFSPPIIVALSCYGLFI